MSVVSAAAHGTPGVLRALGERLERLPVTPVLAGLVAIQLAQAFWFAFGTPHNGWIWYSGGDATSYWTEQWALGHLTIPQAVVGYSLPVYYSWVPLVAGPSLMTGMKVIALFQVLVLVPLALVLFWAVANRVLGRIAAWVATAVWVATPALLLLGFVPKYHWVFDQLFLVPHWFGFTNMGDLPSLVCVLACAWMTLRAVDERSGTDTVLAGLLGGLAIGVKPSNAFILLPVAVLLAVLRRPRQAALWAAGLAPSLLVLLIWKYRGLGDVPITSSYATARLAAGAAGPIAFSTSRYMPLNFGHFHEELVNLREVFWSLRFVEFAVIAGAFGLIRRAPVKGLFVVVWFVSFGILKASSPRSDFPSATYFRLAEPALPAFILLLIGIVYCVPRLGRGRNDQPRRGGTLSPVAYRRIVPAAVVIALVPLLLIVIAQPSKAMTIARDENTVQEAPISSTVHLTATRVSESSVLVRWRAPSTGSTKPWYVLYTSPGYNGCSPPDRGALECMFNMPQLVVTQANHFLDRPGPKRHYYRLAVVASYQAASAGGDLMLMSPPAIAPPAR